MNIISGIILLFLISSFFLVPISNKIYFTFFILFIISLIYNVYLSVRFGFDGLTYIFLNQEYIKEYIKRENDLNINLHEKSVYLIKFTPNSKHYFDFVSLYYENRETFLILIKDNCSLEHRYKIITISESDRHYYCTISFYSMPICFRRSSGIVGDF